MVAAPNVHPDNRDKPAHRADEQRDTEHQECVTLCLRTRVEPQRGTNRGGNEHDERTEQIADYEEREEQNDPTDEERDGGVAVKHAPELGGTDDRRCGVAEHTADYRAAGAASAADGVARMVAANADAVNHPSAEQCRHRVAEFVNKGGEKPEVLPGRARHTEDSCGDEDAEKEGSGNGDRRRSSEERDPVGGEW